MKCDVGMKNALKKSMNSWFKDAHVLSVNFLLFCSRLLCFFLCLLPSMFSSRFSSCFVFSSLISLSSPFSFSHTCALSLYSFSLSSLFSPLSSLLSLSANQQNKKKTTQKLDDGSMTCLSLNPNVGKWCVHVKRKAKDTKENHVLKQIGEHKWK